MIHRTPKQAEDNAIALRARVAQLEEALREQLGYTPGGPCQLPLIPKCICEKCKNDRARAALSGSSSEWLEGVKREAAAEALEKMNYYAGLAVQRHERIQELERDLLNEKCSHSWTEARREMDIAEADRRAAAIREGSR